MTIGERIRELRKARGMSQEEVAKAIGSTKQSVHKYESGLVSNIPKDKVETMATLFSVKPDYLLGWSEKKSGALRVPVYGKVAAGIPIEAITAIEDYEEISAEMASKGEYMALTIHGDSMEPKMSDGDVVIVLRQDDCESGDTAIVMVNGDEATCKRVKKTPEGIYLISTNHAYDPMFFTNKQIRDLPIRILGKVVELRAKF